MPFTALCLMMSCIQVVPDSSQFFRYDSFNLSCAESENSTGWRIRRNTTDAGVRPCASGWGIAAPGSGCQVRNTYPSDTGVYWCESADGNRSNTINITITDRAVLLGSPALPVPAGSAVTLRCKADTPPGQQHTYIFRRDGHLVGSSHTGKFTFYGASKADEGLYTCHIPGFGDSIGSWMTVGGSAPPAASCPPSVARLLCRLAVGTPYLLSTVLLGLIYRDRIRAARTVAERRGGKDDVVMEIVV